MTFQKGLLGFSSGLSASKSVSAKVGGKPLPPEPPTVEDFVQALIDSGVDPELANEQGEWLSQVDPDNPVPPTEPPPGWPDDLVWPFAPN